MALSWSHSVLYVKDVSSMVEFYSDVLGFEVTDRGPLGPADGPEIVFMSQDPDEHHQLAMITTRQEDGASNSVNHFAFRIPSFEDLRGLMEKLEPLDAIKVAPLSHGNTLSIYFNDPEGNGLEVFWDTPWHVAQPQGKPWDPSMTDAALLDWVKENFSSEPSFVPRDEYYDARRAAAE